MENNNEYGKCDICEAPRKLIVRRLTLTTGEHTVIDTAQFCGDCWKGSKREICEMACLGDCK